MSPALNELTLELSQRCFQNCLYCSSGSSSTDNIQLSFDTIKRVLDSFSALGGKVVELSGGEPLCFEKINETVEYASKKGFQVNLFTCAYSPNKKIDIDKLDGVDRFYLNLESPNKIVHDYLTSSPGSFDRVISFIKECRAKGKWVGTHLIPLALNIDEIDEYLKLAKLLKLDNVSLLRFVPQGRGRNHILSLNNDEILQLFSIIEKHKKIDALDFKIGCPLDFRFLYRKSKTVIRCESGISRCVIRPNGNIIPCPAFKDAEEFVAGNVNDKSLVDIWKKSHVFKKLRNFQHEKLKGLCRDCSFLNICRGRCHAQRWHHYGDLYLGPDPYCPLRIILT
ncbi:MAG: radical SAM protein [Flavobacteriaceae bacterium]|nr:radical SAM protein [Flavobacteriaceae bacterium]